MMRRSAAKPPEANAPVGENRCAAPQGAGLEFAHFGDVTERPKVLPC